MDNLITIVRDEILDWEQEASHTNRYSVFTKHLILAEKTSKHQRLTPRVSKPSEDDEKSFHSAESKLPEKKRTGCPPIPPADPPFTSPTALPTASPNASQSLSKQASTGRARTRSQRGSSQRTSKTTKALSGQWTWRPHIPQRTSSMSTRGTKANPPHPLDFATFHRRTCQLFSLLDSILSNAASTSTNLTNDSCTSTSPSLASSISTQATSILDDNWYNTPATSSLHLGLQDPRSSTRHGPRPGTDFGNLLDVINEEPRPSPRKSSSHLSPRITSTKKVFWTSDETRQAEYAKIDAAHRGFKSFMKRILPRGCGWAHGKRRNFHVLPSAAVAGGSSQADGDSVRRFRLSIASATQEAITNTELHGVSTGRVIPMRPSRPAIDQRNLLKEAHPDSRPQISKIENTSPAYKKLGKMKPTDNLNEFLCGVSNTLNKERRAKMLSRGWDIDH